MRKLLIVSSDNVHVYKYIELVKDYFDKILLISNGKNKNYSIDVRKVDFSIRNPIALIRTPHRIRRAIRDFEPTIIHVHQANSIAWYLFRATTRLDVPVVLTAWGSDILVAPKRGGFYRRMVIGNLQKADILTSDSRYMAAEMQTLAGENCPKILIANFGIDLVPLPIKKEKLIYSNRLHNPLYRIDAVIRAFAIFCSLPGNEDWKLSIGGIGEETFVLKNLVESLNLDSKVTFEGWVNKEKNTELYSKSLIFVSIPESDATSISLLEAMACGCIPIVSDLPANREWITDGINGVIATDVSFDFISQALKINPDEVARINKELINHEGTKEVNRRRFLTLYTDLIENHINR